MDLALITSAGLLGLAGTPHCAAMCAAPCAAATAGQGRAGVWGFHVARVASYTVVGALAAASVQTLGAWSVWSPALRSLWTLLHAAALALGLWLMWQGRQPAWMGRWGRLPSVATAAVSAGPLAATAAHTVLFSAAAKGTVPPGPGDFKRRAAVATARRPWTAVTAGALWAAWPCGLLQSALLVAALTGGATSGAAAMALFALASSAGLLLGPWAWRRWLLAPSAQPRERTLARLGGALLVVASGWSLSHDLGHRVAVWCGLA